MKFVQCKNTDDKLLEIVKFCTLMGRTNRGEQSAATFRRLL